MPSKKPQSALLNYDDTSLRKGRHLSSSAPCKTALPWKGCAKARVKVQGSPALAIALDPNLNCECNSEFHIQPDQEQETDSESDRRWRDGEREVSNESRAHIF
mmetsp:Transcript_107444/g.181681  ORF Transcript_107444/g.181681 Transcript_107444/m.181681 type:complete len:103 (-) Transcript_107444:1086-1394(-)